MFLPENFADTIIKTLNLKNIFMKLLKKLSVLSLTPKENYANKYFLKIPYLQIVHKIKNKLPLPRFVRISKTDAPSSDMFNWSLYNLYYRGEIKEAAKNTPLNFNREIISLKTICWKKQKKIRPLHPNHRLLYETIIQLNPESIF